MAGLAKDKDFVGKEPLVNDITWLTFEDVVQASARLVAGPAMPGVVEADPVMMPGAPMAVAGPLPVAAPVVAAPVVAGPMPVAAPTTADPVQPAVGIGGRRKRRRTRRRTRRRGGGVRKRTVRRRRVRRSRR